MYWSLLLLVGPVGFTALLGYLQLTVSELFTRHHPLSLQGYLDVPELNNKKCSIVPGVSACEDVVFFKESAFLACSTIPDRLAWFPPAGKRNAKGRANWKDPMFRYDTQSNQVFPIDVQGVDELISHGIAIYEFPDDPDKIHLFVISHALKHSVVHIFSYRLSTNIATLLHTVENNLVVTPNDITPTGPLSFYASNDHKYREGILRVIEDKTGHWKWTSLVHCDAETNTCKTVAKGLQLANGVLYDEGRKRLVVADTFIGNLFVFDVDADFNLSLKRKIHTDIAMDNVTPLPSGNVLIAGFPDMKKMAQRRKDPTAPCPAMALVMDAKTLLVRPVFREDTEFPMMTTAAVDETGKIFLGGGVRTPGILRCEIDSSWDL